MTVPELAGKRQKCGCRRRIGAEHNIRQLRVTGELHRRVADAINCGEYGFAMDHPTLNREDLAGALARQLFAPAGGAAGYAAQGFPQAAGGVDVSAALMSVRPGIRKIKKMVTTQAVPANTQTVTLPLPKSGYLERPIIRLEALGTTAGFQILQGGTAQAITMNDIRTLVQRLRFELSSTVVPKALSGIANDTIDNLDVAVVNANNNTVPTSGSLSGTAGSTTTQNFVLELSPRFTVSDQNLYGIPYLGALSTVPQLVMDLAPLLGPAMSSPLTAAAAGPTAILVNVTAKVDGWRIDLPAPQAPSSYAGQDGAATQVPGEGLWAESSYLLTTKLAKSLNSVGPGQQTPIDIPIGPMYTRLILLAFVDGILDTESGTAPQSILDHAELSVQQATIIESRYPWQYDSDYRNAYYKVRPKGVFVHSGIDQSGTDEDLWVTSDLGNFQITPFATANPDGNANTRFDLLTQALQPISAAGLYA
jgi:hypothetical protein